MRKSKWVELLTYARACMSIAIKAAGGEDRIRTGDGCAGCGKWSRAKGGRSGRYRERQLKRIEGIHAGTHHLICKPSAKNAGTRVYLSTERVCIRMVAATEALLKF